MPATGVEETLRLPDGRSLCFAQWGAPDGRPVVHFHGAPGSRQERYVDEALTAALGVRFITVDRPGYGGTSVTPGHSLLHFAADIAHLASHLGLDCFQLHAISGGAPYLLAAAHELGDQVSHATVLAGLGPLDRPSALNGMSTRNVEEYTAARLGAAKLREVLARRRTKPVLPASELGAFERIPGFLDMMLENHAEMTRQGVAGILSDDLAFVAPWNFALEDITVPLTLWHGDCDEMVPLHHAQDIAARVPSAVLHVCAGEGHFDMYLRQREALGVSG